MSNRAKIFWLVVATAVALGIAVESQLFAHWLEVNTNLREHSFWAGLVKLTAWFVSTGSMLVLGVVGKFIIDS